MILLSQRQRTVTRKRLALISLTASHFICLACISEYFSNLVDNTATVALEGDRAIYQFQGPHAVLHLVTTVWLTLSMLP